MHTLVRAAVLLAFLAGQLDGAADEEGAVGGGVDHLDEPSVEVDLRGERADGHERRRANAENGRHSLIEEAFVAVCRLLQNQNVTPRALRRSNLHKHTRQHRPTRHNPAAPRASVYTALPCEPIVLAVTLATADAAFWDKAYSLGVAMARVYALLLLVVLAACLGACASVAVEELRKHRAAQARAAAEAEARKAT